MAEAKAGDTVKVHYKGTLEDGTVFDQSEEGGPLEFTIGEGQIIPGFEEAVLGMNPGQSLEVTVPPEKAYGQHREDLVAAIDRAELPDDLNPELGQMLRVQTGGGQSMVVRIAELDDETITLDGNHPLAGEDLTFQIELLEIQ